MLAAADLNDRQQLELPVELPEPRFNLVGSGLVAEVRGQLALVHRGQQPGTEVQLPVKLKVRDGHRAAGQECGGPQHEPQRDGHAGEQLDEASQPDLRTEVGRLVGEHAAFARLVGKGDARGAADHLRDVHWSYAVQRRFIEEYYFADGDRAPAREGRR